MSTDFPMNEGLSIFRYFSLRSKLYRQRLASRALFLVMLSSGIGRAISIDNEFATISATATNARISLTAIKTGNDILITTQPVNPGQQYYFDRYIFEKVTINIQKKKGVDSIVGDPVCVFPLKLIVGPGENPQVHPQAPTTTQREHSFKVKKSDESKANFKISVQGWRPHIETLLDGNMTIPNGMAAWPNRSGSVFTGSLKLYNRNGDNEGTWDVDSGGAIFVDNSTQLNPAPVPVHVPPEPNDGRTTDTVVDSCYMGITVRSTKTSYSEMGPYKYTCPNQPVGRSYWWIHEDYDENSAPGTHGCVGIRGHVAFAGHSQQLSHVAEFHSTMTGYNNASPRIMPDWDHSLSTSKFYIWLTGCPH